MTPAFREPFMFKHLNILGAAIGHHCGRTRYPRGYKPSRGYSYTGDKGERAAARRLRQAERDEQRQEARAQASYGDAWKPGDRLSRRYRLVGG